MHIAPTKKSRGIRLAAMVAVFCVVATSLAAVPVDAISRTAVVQETNNVRSAAHLPRLYQSTALNRAAVAKAESMFQQQYFDHTSPSGQRFWSWLGVDRRRFSQLGENIARGYKSEKVLLQDWMKSGGHRANILGTGFTHIGVGIRSGVLQGKRSTVIVQLFGKKKTTTVLTTGTP